MLTGLDYNEGSIDNIKLLTGLLVDLDLLAAFRRPTGTDLTAVTEGTWFVPSREDWVSLERLTYIPCAVGLVCRLTPPFKKVTLNPIVVIEYAS